MKLESRARVKKRGHANAPFTLTHRRLQMDKFIGFDVDHKHTVVCITAKRLCGRGLPKEILTTTRPGSEDVAFPPKMEVS